MSTPASPPQGLRERNKERRRSTILNCAYQLFAERGYQATTIADIAAAADIAPRTVSLYFPSKQDIVLDGVMGLLKPISDAIDRLKPGESAITAILEALRIRLKESQRPELEHLPVKLKADPEIYGIITATVEHLEQNGVRAIARELGCEPDDPQVRVTLAAMRGIVEHAMFASNADEVDEIVDLGLAFLRGGMRRVTPPSG
jgi:AcrR family transcriptional regulator